MNLVAAPADKLVEVSVTRRRPLKSMGFDPIRIAISAIHFSQQKRFSAMNDVLSPQIMPPPPVATSSRVAFAPGRPDFRRLVMRGAGLELITVGFYRF